MSDLRSRDPEQRRGSREISVLMALAEPIVDRSELRAVVGIIAQTYQTHEGTQLKRFGILAARDVHGFLVLLDNRPLAGLAGKQEVAV